MVSPPSKTRTTPSRHLVAACVLTLSALVAGACGTDDATTLTVYSGRTENLIAPILEEFTAATGIEVAVRYGQSADLALLIDSEGGNSPADVFISQSPGAVGFLAENGRLQTIPTDVLDRVAPEFRNAGGLWVGLSGRARVVVYNTDLVDPANLPTSIFDLTDERHRGMVGLAPANGSFQDFVTAMRDVHGDDVTATWLADMAANDTVGYANNTAIVQAVGQGEISMGLVNHYYVYQALAGDPALATQNHFLPSGDIGALLIVTAASVVDGTDVPDAAAELLTFLLSDATQAFFAEKTFEYPLASGVDPVSELPAFSSVGTTAYDFDSLGGGLERTRELIDASGLEGA